MIILDFGSGNTCKNDLNYVEKMIDELVKVDTGKHEVVIKWQLFREAGDNIPLTHSCFRYAVFYAAGKGYQTTASVFDLRSLKHLLWFEPPFVKIANRPDLYWLAGEVPRRVSIIYSVSKGHLYELGDFEQMLTCVSKYPATLTDYENEFSKIMLMDGISDHTTDFMLYNKYKPSVYECHYKLDDSTGLDAGPFARTPEQLKEIL